jgi:asparagine synthase (glutamine-hydrolysing)
VSAIFGILRFDGDAVAARDLERMANTLRHRGPDGRKFVVDGRAGVGHCLMRVNREDLFEAQPIRDREAGLMVAADCRIDNREELAEQFGIGAAALRDLPDSALVLRAYKEWGEDCAGHLLGDFAFAVWDAGAGKFVLGRDHMGQRNVFYHAGDNFFAFATEIKALWALADVPRRLLDEEIARFFHMVREELREGGTLYAGIYAVPGATVVTAATDRSVKLHRYWEPHGDPAHENRDENYYVEKYRSILTEAVACRLRRLTAPAALLNSAGFDTAAIAGLAGPVVTAQGRKLISLSWLGADPDRPERGDIRPWIEACRRVMPHLDIRQVTGEIASPLAGLERAFSVQDGPSGGTRRTAGYLFTAANSAGARLIMDGFGGDYTLNHRGQGALARHVRRGQLRRLFAELRPHLRATGQSPWRMLSNEILLHLLPHWLIGWQRYVRQKGVSAWFTRALREIEGPHLRKLRKCNAKKVKPPLEVLPLTAMREINRRVANRISRGFAAGWAVSAAAHGLELSRPFHDKRVVELGLAIPEDLYVRDGLNRYLARRALADVYPPEFQSRGRKNEGMLGDAATQDLTSPDLLSEADRLAKTARFSAYFDFERARDFLAAPDQAGPAAEKKIIALRALRVAKFIEWFNSSNTS